MNYIDIALFAAKTLNAKKALDITVIHVGMKATFAEYMVLASGTSIRQIGALQEHLEEAFEKEKIIIKNIEGTKESGWILLDCGDIIVNVLTVEMREKYYIEKVWGDCQFLPLEEKE